MHKSKKVLNVAGVFLEIEWNKKEFSSFFTNQYNSFFVNENIVNPDYTVFVELANGKKFFSGNKKSNWTIVKIDKDYYSFIVKSSKTTNILCELIFSLNTNKWKLVFYNNENVSIPFRLNPFFHPIGTVIIQYALILKNAFFIHGSGINYNDTGIIFTGKSGFGKTTISEIFKQNGTTVIHDDRLIVRKVDNSYQMFNSPMINVSASKQSSINTVFSIYHSEKNCAEKLLGIEAFRNIVPNIIQHNVDKAFISILSDTYSDFIKSNSIYSLGFIPDNKIIKFVNDIINK